MFLDMNQIQNLQRKIRNKIIQYSFATQRYFFGLKTTLKYTQIRTSNLAFFYKWYQQAYYFANKDFEW